MNKTKAEKLYRLTYYDASGQKGWSLIYNEQDKNEELKHFEKFKCYKEILTVEELEKGKNEQNKN